MKSGNGDRYGSDAARQAFLLFAKRSQFEVAWAGARRFCEAKPISWTGRCAGFYGTKPIPGVPAASRGFLRNEANFVDGSARSVLRNEANPGRSGRHRRVCKMEPVEELKLDPRFYPRL